MKMLKSITLLLAAFAGSFIYASTLSEIKVKLTLDHKDYVSGERIRGVADVLNASPRKVSVGYANSPDKLIFEVFRDFDKEQIGKISDGPCTARFVIEPNQGQKLEVFLGDHYMLLEEGRYLVRPVLIHEGFRYEGMTRSFNIVKGIRQVSALQLFEGRDELRRNFELVKWTRDGHEHIFLAAQDNTSNYRNWTTTDLGSFLRVTKPVISILETGVVIVLHRLDPEQFVRSEFWSVPNDVVLISAEIVQDPETAAQKRIRELNKLSGANIEPPSRKWWEFWKL